MWSVVTGVRLKICPPSASEIADSSAEAAAPSGEVLIELVSCRVEAAAEAQDPWADLAREDVEHRVVILCRKRQSHETFARGGEQQRTVGAARAKTKKAPRGAFFPG